MKNLNSFRSVKHALSYEIDRQARTLDSGGVIRQVTMGWDEQRGRTVEQRVKEESDDYRYFPEPDLPPLCLPREWVDEIAALQPELPDAKRERFISEYRLPQGDADILAVDRDVATYFEVAVSAARAEDIAPKTVSNWIVGELFRWLKSEDVEIAQVPVSPTALVGLVALVENGTITANSGKTVMADMLATGRPAGEIVQVKGLAQVSDQATLERIIDDVLAANPEQVARYRDGKETLLQWFVGKVMRATRGKANPGVAKSLLTEKLKLQ